ncbi:MAG: response regulator [Nitrospira sp.]
MSEPDRQPTARPQGLRYRHQFVLIGLITLATVTAALAGAAWLVQRTVATSGETVSIMAAEVAAKLDLVVNERLSDIRILSESALFGSGSPAEQERVLDTFQRTYPIYLWLGFADATGRVTAATHTGVRNRDVHAEAWFQAVQSGRAAVQIRDIEPDEASRGADALSITAALHPNPKGQAAARFRGAVTTRVGVNQLELLVTESIRLFQQRTSFFQTVEYKIIRENGDVFIDSDVRHRDRVNLAHADLPSIRLAKSGGSGYVEEEHFVRQVPVLTGYARMQGPTGVEAPKWTVLLRVNRAEVVEPVYRFLWAMAAVVLSIVGPLVGFLVRTTGRAQTEWENAHDERARARSNEQRLRMILEVEPEGVLVTDPGRRVLQINPAGCSLFDAGFPEEIVGRDISQFVHEDDRHECEAAHASALQGRSVLYKGRLTGLTGLSRWFEMTSVPLPGEGDTTPSVLSVLRDITDQQSAERRQLLQHAVAKVLAEASTVDQAMPELLRAIATSLEWQVGVFWQVDDTSRTLACTHTWGAYPVPVEEFLERSRGEVFGSGIGFPGRCWVRGEPMWEADVTRDQEFLRSAAAARSGLHSGCAFPVWLRTSVFGIMEFFSREIHPRDADLLRTLGTIGTQIGLFLERTEVEAALRENETRTRLIIDSSLDAIVMMDRDGVITEWNPQAEQLFGWPAHEAIGRDLADTIVPESYRAAHREGVARYLSTGESRVLGRLLEFSGRHRDGREFPIEVSIAPVRVEGGVMFSAFLRDISSRKESEQALSTYAQQLERSNRDLDEALGQARAATEAKSAFLATMSHEIRTPMNGVIGMTGLLLDTELNAEQREYAEAVRNCGDHLLTVINDILDFSKIEAGKLTLEVIDFDLRHAVEDSLDLFGERASSKRLNLACLFHADVPSALRGDPGRVRQVLTNLVGNAIKFTDKGEVVVQVRLEAQEAGAAVIRFEVTDTGIGISEEQQARLFKAFSQADGSTTRKYGGTGLGLAISKRLVDMMGGTIGVTSQPECGSSFWFTARFELQAVQAGAASPDSVSLRGISVLIVDDKAINRRILELLAKKWGMRAAVFGDGPAALNHLRHQAAQGTPYDLAILDFDMADLDGLQLAQAMIQSTAPTSPRIVLLTSVGRRGDAKAAKETGVSAYLTKPVRESQLARCLAVVLDQSRSPKRDSAATTRRDLVTRHTLAEANVSTGMKILLAEDNMINQKVAVRMFERFGHRVDVVANGLEAVEALSRIPYDLVFMDCQMPEMDGFEATRVIRERERPSPHRTPIIAMTANAMQGDREQCLRAGMDDYVSKPVTSNALAAVFARWRRSVPPEETVLGGSPSSRPLDAGVFASLRELSGEDDPGFLSRLITHFLADTPTRLSTLGTACRQGRADDVRRIAHSLKGSAANLGALGMADRCDRISRASTGTLDSVPPLLADLELEFQRVRGQLEEDLREAA